jgi:hypothetical protein
MAASAAASGASAFNALPLMATASFCAKTRRCFRLAPVNA